MTPESRLRTDRKDRRWHLRGRRQAWKWRREREPKAGWASSENNRPGVPGNCVRVGGRPRGRDWGQEGGWEGPHPSCHTIPAMKHGGLQSAAKAATATCDINRGLRPVTRTERHLQSPRLHCICQDSPPWCQRWKRGGLCTCWATLSLWTAGPRQCGLPHTHTDHTAVNAGKRGASGSLLQLRPNAPNH